MLDVSSLNKEQLQAVKHKSGPLLVVAGAGTGKTQVITYRIARLISEQHAKPAEIVALTFTDKAAQEMETRVAELLETFIFDVNITTFNAFGYDILQRYCFDIGLSSNLQVLNQTQQIVFLKENMDHLQLDYYAPITNPESMLGDIAGYFSQLKQQLITPAVYSKFAQSLKKQAKTQAEQLEAKRHQELAHAYGAYIQLCRQRNLIDFDDQIYLTVELLENRPNVRQQLQAQYKYWLVDEFQDTNLAQSRLLDLLVDKQQNVVAVGDDDQCIYRFRGAAITNILGFKQRYPRAKQLVLVQNYRSSQSILDSAYRLIQHNNPERLESKYKLNKRLQAQYKGRPPVLKNFAGYETEAEWLAADIAEYLKKPQAEPADVAVLLRKNSQAAMLQRYLDGLEIPYLVVGQGEDLYAQGEVKLLLNWLRVVADPTDSTALYHLLASEAYQVPATWLREQAARARAEHLSLEQRLRQLAADAAIDEPSALLTRWFEQLEVWRAQLPQLSVGQLAYRFLEDSGYLQAQVKAARKDPGVDAKLGHLNQFFTTLLDFERIATDNTAVGYLQNLPALLGSGERVGIEDIPELGGQRVRLLTVHRAKGLEFERVYLFDLTQGTFPARAQPQLLQVPDGLAAAAEAGSQLTEERRLMYVACTRAKQTLVLTTAYDHGGSRPRRPSQFIEEALGHQPKLDLLRQPLGRTSQIELFRSRSTASAELPASLLQEDKLLLTAGQIEDYLMCPAEFYLRHVLAPPQPPSAALEYGSLLHGVVQLYNRQKAAGRPVRLNQLLAHLREHWPKAGFISSGHQRRSLKQAQATVQAFYKREQAGKRHPQYIERAWEWELPQHKLQLRGRFDAVYEDAESVEIRDYKTGGSRITNQAKADQRAKDSLQLGIYALAWQALRGRSPDVVSLDFIDQGRVGSAVKSARQLQTVEQRIQEVAIGVRSGDFRPGRNHIFCSHQEYGF